jgi:hypothetical protein
VTRRRVVDLAGGCVGVLVLVAALALRRPFAVAFDGAFRVG